MAWMYCSLFNQSSVERHLEWFQFLAITNKVATRTCFCVNMVSFLWYKCPGMQLHVYFKKKLPNCFPEWLYHFIFPQAMYEWLRFLHILAGIWCCHYFFQAIVVSVSWYLIVILICSSLTANNVDYFFICLFDICVSSLVKCLFMYFSNFLIFFSVEFWEFFIYSIYEYFEYVVCKYFLPVYSLYFNLQMSFHSKIWFL